jgi:undecaprenyl-diphosphatase
MCQIVFTEKVGSMALEIKELPKTKKPMTKKQRLFFAFACLFLGITVFGLAYVNMKQQNGFGAFNQPVLAWMVNHRFAFLTEVAKIVTTSASLWSVVISVGLIVAAWIFLKKEVWRPSLLAIAMGLSALTSTILKLLTMDIRPPQVNMVPMFEIDYSFPSGHTLAIAVFLLVLGYLVYSRHYSFGRFFGWMMVTVFGTGIIALSRLYLGYHWLTDVIASVGLAFIIMAIMIFIDQIFHKIKQLD